MLLTFIFIALSLKCGQSRWSEEKANQWYSRFKWGAGVNYIPAYAVNEI